MPNPHCSSSHCSQPNHSGYRHAETIQEVIDAAAAGDCFDIDGDKTLSGWRGATFGRVVVAYEGGSFDERPQYFLVPEVASPDPDEVAAAIESIRRSSPAVNA